MTERAVFCSYARRDAAAVATIATELDRLGQRAWLDEKLSGGQAWWDTILEQVRGCDCFLFALSDASVDSKACMAELDYAHRLQRTIMPVSVSYVPEQLLPPYLAETQHVPANDIHRLARALLSLPPTPPLPQPLPEPPPVPISYLDGLASQIAREELTTAEQRNLEGDLKMRLADPDERDAALALLRRLRRHPSVNAWVAADIDADLADLEHPPPGEEAPAGEPVPPPPGPEPAAGPAPVPPSAPPPDTRRIVVPPAGPDRPGWEPEPPRWDSARRQRGGRTGLIAALLLVAALAVAGAVVWVVSSGDDDTPPSQQVPTESQDQSPGTTGESSTTDTTQPQETTTTTSEGGDAGGGSAGGT